MRESPTRFFHNTNKHKWLYKLLLLLSSSILFYLTHFRFNSLAILDATYRSSQNETLCKFYCCSIILLFMRCKDVAIYTFILAGCVIIILFIFILQSNEEGKMRRGKRDLIMQTCICSTMPEVENLNVIG